MYPCPRLPHEGQALFTGHGLRVPGSDAFDRCTVSGFSIPGITGDHAILVQEVQVLILAPSSISGLHFGWPTPWLSSGPASQTFPVQVYAFQPIFEKLDFEEGVYSLENDLSMENFKEGSLDRPPEATGCPSSLPGRGGV